MPQELQQINVARAPQPLLQWVAISNRMDYSLWWHALVMSGKSHNPPLNAYHLQPIPMGKSQGCHSSHYKPQETIKLSPKFTVLEQHKFADLSTRTDHDLWGHLKDSPALTLHTVHVSATPLQKHRWALQQHTAANITCRAENWDAWRSNNTYREKTQASNSQPSSLGPEMVA